MTKINLRDYLRGIEELVDDHRTEDAVAHCRHILSIFPKNVATYRVMGKVYLEAHRHNEAGELFQRVLTSIPDDFVSHIGMSIIHEEAGDLNRAVWNMERAFESQPSNRAVQDELRRLYGKREGYALPKVRLTRGALARMYAHGDLYNQAIGELRSALAEDPQRPDLQVLLAEMYFKTKQEGEAIAVCQDLIQQLPYCLYANRLMADILRGNGRDADAESYLERVQELDPYAALVDTQTDVDTAPSDSVMLEQLEMESPFVKPAQAPSAWTGSLGSGQHEFQKEELPAWLSDIAEPVAPGRSGAAEEPLARPQEIPQEPAAVVEKPATEEQPAEKNSQEVIEEPATEEQPMAESEEGVESLSIEAEPTPPEKTPSAPLTEDQLPDWLRELRPTTSMLAAQDFSDTSKEDDSGPLEEEQLDEEMRSEKVEVESEDFQNESKEPEPAEKTAPSLVPTPTSELPEWLSELRPSTSALAEDAARRAPEEVEPPVSFEAEDKEEERSYLTEEFKSTPEANMAPPDFEGLGPGEAPLEGDEDLGWLEKLAAQEGAPEEELLTTPEEREAAHPEWLPDEKVASTDALAWLDEGAATAGEEETEEPSAALPTTEFAPPAEKEKFEVEGTTPLWLKNLSPEVEEGERTGEETEGAAAESQAAEFEGTGPLWLKKLSGEIEESVQTGDEFEERAAEPEAGTSGWLDELRPSTDEIKAAETAAEETSSVEERFPVEGTTPLWLKELSSEIQENVPAEEAGEITPQPLEEAPEWLRELKAGKEEPAEKPEEEAVAAKSEEPAPMASQSELDWLEELGAPKVPPVKGEWLPEIPVVSNGNVEPPTPAPVPAATPAAAVRSRRSAALASQEGPRRLEQARQALNFGKLGDAADHYGYLLRRRWLVKDVIADLDAAVHRNPGDATLWQVLGDAYMRNNQLRKALDCYTRAEDLL